MVFLEDTTTSGPIRRAPLVFTVSPKGKAFWSSSVSFSGSMGGGLSSYVSVGGAISSSISIGGAVSSSVSIGGATSSS